MDKKKGGCLAPSTSLMRRLPSSYVLGMLPVLKQQIDGAMAHAPSSHHARVPACHDENAVGVASFVRICHIVYLKFHRILSRHQLIEFELCILGNLCPETAEEAVAMVLFLKVQ
ncbi:unnamed protein product [Brassica oleracea]